MVRMVEIDASGIECPLFSSITGTGMLCNVGGIVGKVVSVQADTTAELCELMEMRCRSDFASCPAYRKVAGMTLVQCEIARKEGGVL